MTQDLIKDGHLDRQAAAAALQQFLDTTIRAAGFQLKVTVHTVAPDAGGEAEVLADLDGRDKELLLERGAEVLKALEHLGVSRVAPGAGLSRKNSPRLRWLSRAAI